MPAFQPTQSALLGIPALKYILGGSWGILLGGSGWGSGEWGFVTISSLQIKDGVMVRGDRHPVEKQSSGGWAAAAILGVGEEDKKIVMHTLMFPTLGMQRRAALCECESKLAKVTVKPCLKKRGCDLSQHSIKYRT